MMTNEPIFQILDALNIHNVVIHPLRNTASISIKFDDLKRFTEHFGHKWMIGDVYKEE